MRYSRVRQRYNTCVCLCMCARACVEFVVAKKKQSSPAAIDEQPLRAV